MENELEALAGWLEDHRPGPLYDMLPPIGEVTGKSAAKMLRDLSKARAEAAPILKAQGHAILCGAMALELQSALAMLTNACAEDGWPKTAEQMAPMNMARAAMNLKLGDMNSPRSDG